MENIKKILKIFNKREKRNLLVLFSLMIIAAVVETLGIGLVVPFVGIVTNPEMIQEQAILSFLYDSLGFQSTNSFLIFSTLSLIFVFIFKNVFLLGFYYLQYRFISNQRVKNSRRLLKVYLTKPYEFHIQKNSAELLRNVNNEVNKVFSNMMLPSFQFAIEVLVIIFILILLIIMEPMITLFSSVLLGTSVVVFFKVFKKKISSLGKLQQATSRQMIKWINQGLGASKEVKVSGREGFFIQSFSKQSEKFAVTVRFYRMLNQIPRMVNETIIVSSILGMVLIIILRGGDMSTLLATMALFAMAAFRLMPSINRMVSAISTIKYNAPALDVIYDDLIAEIENEERRNQEKQEESNYTSSERIFQHAIELENVSYRYPNQSDYTVSDVSLKIPIGKSVAIVGASGAGKTTIVDIILGLLEPEKGRVLVDGIDLKDQLPLWKKKIGYIPQDIYLSDDSIRKNIAFGINDKRIEDESVWRALVAAQLKDYVEKLPEGLDTFVGERGIRLSGGQRQRIGIARALYHNPEILILDEATSALDNETEKGIMSAIDGLKGEKTLIIIAHRLSTIENCDIVFEIVEGELKDSRKVALSG